MMKKSKRKCCLITVGAVVVLVCLALSGFVVFVVHEFSIPRVLARYSLDKPFPERDIIFLRKWGGNELGFINADGSGLEYVRLDTSHGLKRFLYGDTMPGLRSYFTWSSDGKAVFMNTSKFNTGFPAMLEVDGRQGILYTLDSGFENLSLYGEHTRYVSVIPGTRQALFGDAHQAFPHEAVLGMVELDRETVFLVRYIENLASDEQIDLIIGPNPWCNEDALVFAYHSYANRTQLIKHRIVLYNILDNRESIVLETSANHPADDSYPSCSPNGHWVAYTSHDGIHLVHPDGSDMRKIETTSQYYENGFPVASWSPDGQWIVYHDCIDAELCQKGEMAIFKYNVETGERVKLTDEGVYPYWRQPAEAGSEIRLEP